MIALAAAALVVLAADAVRRQRQAVTALAESNRRLLGEKLARDLETLARSRAEALLLEPRFEEAVAIAVEAKTPADVRRSREVFEEVRTSHPIARHFFVADVSGLRFPLTRDLPRCSFRDLLEADESPVADRFATLLEEGESLEIRERNPGEALERYREASKLETSAPMKALVLSRLARCQRKLGEREKAERLYRQLRQQHGDEYDRFHRPYGLVASLALGEVPSDLARGRWELSGQQFHYFQTALPGPPSAETQFVDHLTLGALLENQLGRIAPDRPVRLASLELADRGRNRQIFYTTTVGRISAGFEADLEWIADSLLHEAMSRAELSDVSAHVAPVTGGELSFPTLFPFWSLTVNPETEAPRDGLFATGIILVLFVLGLGLFVVVRDASRERRLAELRSDLVSGVSHELRTPLTLIRLYAETLLHGGKHTDEEQQGFQSIILRESERLSHLVDKVLHFARIQRQQRHYYLEEGDIASVIADTVEAYEEYLTRRGFQVEAELEQNLPPVKFDASAVSQAVVNLVDNAVKYSDDDRHVTLRLFAKAGSVIFEVEDHGVGIAPEDQERIFDQFYRSDVAEAGGGYGLGLFLVAHIMAAHGGRVWVESEPNRGSTFRLVFPSHGEQPE